MIAFSRGEAAHESQAMETNSWCRRATLRRLGSRQPECTGLLNDVVEHAVNNPLPGDDRWLIICDEIGEARQFSDLEIADLAALPGRPAPNPNGITPFRFDSPTAGTEDAIGARART